MTPGAVPPRVALVLGTSTGGVGTHVRELAEGLIAVGARVTVAAPGTVQAQFRFSGVGARAIDVEFGDRPSWRGDRTAIAALRDLLRWHDVVHAHGLRAGALAVLAARGSATPVVVTLHNARPEGRLTGAVYGLLERLVARGADAVLGVSADLVDRMAALGARHPALAVVPAPAPRSPARGRDQVRADLGVPPTAPLAVSVGRLAPQKDPLALVRAVALVPRVHLAVAGDGPLRAAVEALARDARVTDRVHLLGHRGDIHDLLAAADVVVSTALWEGQPVWLQEALQQHCAIVATDAGGTAAVLGGAGLLIPPKRPEAVAEALRRVLDDPNLAAAMRARAGDRAASLPTRADAVRAALAAYAPTLT